MAPFSMPHLAHCLAYSGVPNGNSPWLCGPLCARQFLGALPVLAHLRSRWAAIPLTAEEEAEARRTCPSWGGICPRPQSAIS